MHAVSRAVDIAAREPLVRLHECRRVACDRAAHGAHEPGVAPKPADVEGIDDAGLDATPLRGPFARVERHGHAALRERFERAREESLGASERRVALADDGKPHQRGVSRATGADFVSGTDSATCADSASSASNCA